MGKIKIKLNQHALDRIGRDAVTQYAKRHSHECAYCHKRVETSAGTPEGTLPAGDLDDIFPACLHLVHVDHRPCEERHRIGMRATHILGLAIVEILNARVGRIVGVSMPPHYKF